MAGAEIYAYIFHGVDDGSWRSIYSNSSYAGRERIRTWLYRRHKRDILGQEQSPLRERRFEKADSTVRNSASCPCSFTQYKAVCLSRSCSEETGSYICFFAHSLRRRQN